jgi:hypothetical protein
MLAAISQWIAERGDEGILPWVVTLSYLMAGGICLARPGTSEAPYWKGFGAFMILMGLNKQLDLQTLWRCVFRDELAKIVIPADRRNLERLFIFVLSAVALTLFGLLEVRLRNMSTALRVAGVGVAIIVVFALFRGAIFDHIIKLSASGVSGDPQWLELLGAILAGGAAASSLFFRPFHQR